MWIKDQFNKLLENGIWLKIRIGKMFDPYYQKRTDAIDDLVKQQSKKVKKTLNKIFKITKE